jgi:hypothetical protein
MNADGVMDNSPNALERLGMMRNELGEGLSDHGPTATKRALLLLHRTSDLHISTVLAAPKAPGVKIGSLVKWRPGSRLS